MEANSYLLTNYFFGYYDIMCTHISERAAHGQVLQAGDQCLGSAQEVNWHLSSY